MVLRYDGAGNCIEQEYDDNADGVFDYIDALEFNAFGQQTYHLYHSYDNGFKYRFTTTYDSDGNVTLRGNRFWG